MSPRPRLCQAGSQDNGCPLEEQAGGSVRNARAPSARASRWVKHRQRVSPTTEKEASASGPCPWGRARERQSQSACIHLPGSPTGHKAGLQLQARLKWPEVAVQCPGCHRQLLGRAVHVSAGVSAGSPGLTEGHEGTGCWHHGVGSLLPPHWEEATGTDGRRFQTGITKQGHPSLLARLLGSPKPPIRPTCSCWRAHSPLAWRPDAGSTG